MKCFSYLVLALSVGLFAAGCTKPTPAPPATSGSNTTSVDDHEGHDHEGHDHEGETQPETSGEAPAGDDFGAPPAEPEISLDPAAPATPENE